MRKLAAALIAVSCCIGPANAQSIARSCSDQGQHCVEKCAEGAKGGSKNKCQRKCAKRQDECMQTGAWRRGDGTVVSGLTRR